MTGIVKIEGIGAAFGAKLAAVGIRSTEQLLKRAATPRDRQALAEKTGFSQKQILEWANRADLFRVRGIGEEYSDLLEAAGVDTVAELAQRKPENLQQKMIEANQERELVRQLPALSQVANWIDQARQLPRILSY